MNNRSQKSELKQFIKALPELSNVLDIRVDRKVKEISIKSENDIIKFFYHKFKKCFIIFRKGKDYCEINDVKFSDKETTRLRNLINLFIQDRLYSNNSKIKSSGITRTIFRSEDQNLK